MKFTFNYEETLQRRVTVNADNLSEAIAEIHRRIDKEEIILGAEDFVGAEIRIPCEDNIFPQLQRYGNSVENVEGFEIVIDYW